MLSDLKTAAASATANPDGFLDRLVIDRSRGLASWADTCEQADTSPGSLASAAHA